MNALAYKSKTIPPISNDKIFPISADDLFDEKIEFSQTRIRIFLERLQSKPKLMKTITTTATAS